MPDLLPEDLPFDLIRLREAAKLVGCHWSSLYKAIHRGELAAWRCGPKVIMVSRSEVLRNRIGRLQPKHAPAPVSTAVQRQRDARTAAILKEAGIG